MTQTWQMTFFLGALLPPSGLEYGHFEKVPSFFFFFFYVYTSKSFDLDVTP